MDGTTHLQDFSQVHKTTQLYKTPSNRRDGMLITFFVVIEPTQDDVERFIEQNPKMYKKFLEGRC